jgi:hypothetical protein
VTRRKMTPSEVATNAALTRWATEDPTVNAVRGQAGLRAKFLREVDAHAAGKGEELSEAERQRRADVRYKLHMRSVRRARTVRQAPDGEAA